LVYFKDGFINWPLFFFISIIFLIGEIGHNDYFRIKLNHAACEKCQCAVNLEKAKKESERN
jgi:hypothetical protein